MEPSATAVTAFSGETISELVVSTSQMRLAPSSAMVIMANTIEIIIRLMRIMKP